MPIAIIGSFATGIYLFTKVMTDYILKKKMIEKGFVTETTGDWFDGDIHFGFNISRVFTVWSREE